MIKKILLSTVALGAAFSLGAMVTPQNGPPPVDVGERHGNMRAAQ